ncbi:MAG: hypothetical protein JGK08_23110 [Microcoleus sp. PH2017_04_SCI_O_A]|nr:hypothetical protein [Microcoleus sp. PH2017_04_SCI_O_A]
MGQECSQSQPLLPFLRGMRGGKCDRPKTITAFLQKTIALFGESDRLDVNY